MANKLQRSATQPVRSKITVPKREKRLLLIVLSLLFCIATVEPAFAETIRVPWPVWLVFQLWYFGVWLVSTVAWAVAQLWNLTIAGLNAFWVFIAFIVFVPLPKLILGAVVTIGGAFLPDVNPRRKTTETGAVEISEKKLSFKGAPRYAVCLVGILIVASSMFDGYVTASASSSQTNAASPTPFGSERTVPPRQDRR
jgi:hypothetical protein